MNHYLKVILLVLICGLFGEVYAQKSVHEIDLDQISQKKVRELLLQLKEHQIEYFSDFKPSVTNKNELAHFMSYEKEYIVKQDRDLVWDNYINSNQTDIWDIHRVSVGFLYSKDCEAIVYADHYYFGLEKGQIFFLNLKLLNGLYNLPVAFEITKIDEGNKMIEFSYLKGGKARGAQVIQLMSTDRGYTKVVHKSYVQSHSKFRDKYLYPYFHNKIINEFHGNMRRLIAYRAKNLTNTLTSLK